MKCRKFVIEWKNKAGMRLTDIAEETLLFEREPCMITITKKTPDGTVKEESLISVKKKDTETFFEYLDAHKWEKNYKTGGMKNEYAMILDCGFFKRKVRGDADYPPHGRELQNAILSLVKKGGYEGEPVLFGIGD